MFQSLLFQIFLLLQSLILLLLVFRLNMYCIFWNYLIVLEYFVLFYLLIFIFAFLFVIFSRFLLCFLGHVKSTNELIKGILHLLTVFFLISTIFILFFWGGVFVCLFFKLPSCFYMLSPFSIIALNILIIFVNSHW